ncbi:MAG: Uma2 family endonuclease [Planctomycetaceae bacterium]
MSTTQRAFTDEFHLHHAADEANAEIVDGNLTEREVSGESSRITAMLLSRLFVYLSGNPLGNVFGPDCGYRCFGAGSDGSIRIRRPDVSFVSAGRMSQDEYESGYLQTVPDLAVEVVSPNDMADELDQKLEEYLQAGVKQVWIIHPRTQTVEIYTSDGHSVRLHAGDRLTADDLLPGFQCQVADVFPKLV